MLSTDVSSWLSEIPAFNKIVIFKPIDKILKVIW